MEFIKRLIALAPLLVVACATPVPPPPPPPPAPYVTIEGDPPVIPWQETIVDDGGYFKEICVSRLKAIPEKLQWQWGYELLTQNKDHAYIWRRDFSTPRDIDPTRLHRVICSLLPSGGINLQIATDQEVEPLQVSAAALVTQQAALK